LQVEQPHHHTAMPASAEPMKNVLEMMWLTSMPINEQCPYPPRRAHGFSNFGEATNKYSSTMKTIAIARMRILL
jgi:hypothetical protein